MKKEYYYERNISVYGTVPQHIINEICEQENIDKNEITTDMIKNYLRCSSSLELKLFFDFTRDYSDFAVETLVND